MPTRARHGNPYVYTTWLTGLLAGEDNCPYAPWFKAHYQFDKLERGFDLAGWKAEHSAMVNGRRAELETEGYTVTVEDQNTFKLLGATATLSGKADLVARRGAEVLVVDCKGGKARDADFYQVLIYLFALPLVWAKQQPTLFAAGPLRWRGEVCYRDHRLPIEPEELTRDQVARLTALVRQCGASERPAKVPSARECRCCDLGRNDCAERVEAVDDAVTVADF